MCGGPWSVLNRSNVDTAPEGDLLDAEVLTGRPYSPQEVTSRVERYSLDRTDGHEDVKGNPKHGECEVGGIHHCM